MRSWASAVENQGSLGSCTANAIAGSYELLLNKYYPEKFTELSRLFVYYNARLLDNSVNEDTGAYIRDGIKSVKHYGICAESLWPYYISRFTVAPNSESYEDAKTRNIKNYFRVTGLDNIIDALNNSHPIVVGILVYSDFDKLDSRNTILSPPATNATHSPLGGHAVLLVGYDYAKRLILARNSFGPDWCMDGYFWMTFKYVESQVMDAWVFDIELIDVPVLTV